jgi:hypothetical protein
VIEDDDLGETALEHGTVDVIQPIDALGAVAERVLHERGDVTGTVLEDKVDVVAHLADGEDSDAGEARLRLGDPESEDLFARVRGEETELRSLAANGDVEELAWLTTSRSSHADGKCTLGTK